jgi:hypothetical protein
MKLSRWQAAGAVLTLAIAAAAHAQPANDECTGAIAVVDGNNNVDNTGATTSVTLPGTCLAYDAVNFVYAGPTFSGVDTWYSYTAPATGIRNFEIINDANSPPTSTLALYDSCGPAMTLLACNTGGGISSNGKIRHYPVTGGTTYYIRYSIYGATGTGVAANVLNISAPPTTPVAFDDCELATPVAGQPLLVPFDLAATTNGDVRYFDCDPFRRDGWFAWTPSMSGIGLVRGCSDTVPLNSNQLRFAAHASCDTPPLVCMQNVNDPGWPTACFPDIAWNVTAGQTYLIRVAVGRMTTVMNGSLVFEVRPPATGFAIPAGAIPESEPCSDISANDTNDGCAIAPHVSEPIELCRVYSGTTNGRRELFPGALNAWPNWDNDSYEFTLPADDTITITGQSEFFPRTELRVGCDPFATVVTGATNNVAPTVGLTYNLGEKRVSGVVSAFTVTLVAGTYQYFISPVGSANGGPDCSGGNRYWFKITSASTECSGACCTGTSCSSSTQAACTGTYQGDGSACGPMGNPTTCCPANFNGAGGVTVQDIFDFLAAYFSGDLRADFNQAGGVSVQDIFDYLAAYFAGC